MTKDKKEEKVKNQEKVTDVTSLAEEKEKGSEVPAISKDEMKQISLRDYHGGMITLERDLKTAIKSSGSNKISARGLLRVLIATLQFPEPDLKVDVQPGVETHAFAIAQRVQMARFFLMLDAVHEKNKKDKEEKPKKAKKKTKKNPKEEKKNG